MYEIYRIKLYEESANYTLVGSPDSENLRIISGEMDLSVNEAGMFKFKIPPTHAYYGAFTKLLDGIVVILDGWNYQYFRVLKISRDFWNNEVITCEGILSFLKDMVCFPYKVDLGNNVLRQGTFDGEATTTTITKENLVKWILGSGSYQSLMTFIKNVTVTTETHKSVLARIASDGNSILDEMRALISVVGGFVYGEYTGYENYNARLKFYYTDANAQGKTCTQVIEYGKNLMDLTMEDSGETVYTSCFGVGDVVSGVSDENNWGDEGRITAKEYTGSYVVDAGEATIAAWGRRIIYKKFEGANTSAMVAAYARNYVLDLYQSTLRFSIKAIDLRSFDSTQDGFTCGDRVPIKSDPYGIDGTYLCSQAHIDLCDISKTYYSFGGKLSSISSMVGRK